MSIRTYQTFTPCASPPNLNRPRTAPKKQVPLPRTPKNCVPGSPPRTNGRAVTNQPAPKSTKVWSERSNHLGRLQPYRHQKRPVTRMSCIYLDLPTVQNLCCSVDLIDEKAEILHNWKIQVYTCPDAQNQDGLQKPGSVNQSFNGLGLGGLGYLDPTSSTLENGT